MARNSTTAFISILILFGLFTGPPASNSGPDANSASVAVDPPVSIATVVYPDGASPEQRATVEWAVRRFAEAGLQLPDLEISFPTSCGGKAGQYVVGQSRIELCRSHRKIVLHELAHAWDDSTDLDRDGFLQLRGLEEWYDRPAIEANQTGGEQLALVVTWALFDGDLTKPVSPLDSSEDGERHLPGLDNSSPTELAESFTLLTGNRSSR